MPQDTRVGVGTAVCIFRETGLESCVLLGKRKGSHGAGLYSPPGGWLEFQESFQAGAVRELAEETGIKLSPEDVKVSHVANTVTADMHFVTVYLGVYLSDEIEPKLLEPNKCEGWEWHNVYDLPPEEQLFWGVKEGVLKTYASVY